MSAPQPYNEQFLLEKMAVGLQEAFTEIYEHYHPALHRFLTGYVKSPQLAEDLSQEIFMKIWEKRGTLKNLNSFKAYLFVVARNHTLTTLKNIGRKESTLAEIVQYLQPSIVEPEDTILLTQYSAFYREMVDSLPL